ncbi:NERD domain-containing protein [Streptomyces sp. NPDC005878]|uniref:nuclease-related domain-containing protein n=1 Tax=Streptomyces sp. NPDC005878 TaxID=3157077 RepID=UPI003410B4F4
MSAAGSSGYGRAARLRARRPWWQRLLALIGIQTVSARQAEALATRAEIGAAAEQATAVLLAPLTGRGWWIGHDRALPRSRANLDHILVSPCGTAVVVLDTKRWHRGWPTRLVNGRVHCGNRDRQDDVDKVAAYTARVGRALGLPGVAVWPLLVVHGSPLAGGSLEARAKGWPGPVYLVSAERLVATLASAPKTLADPARAAALAAIVNDLFPPYIEGSRP